MLIPAGTFTMGCDAAADADCSGDELPLHLVNLDAYRIDAYEVTVALYADCVGEGVCAPPRLELGPDYPVLGVTIAEATTFCEWRGMLLPTEAQWERAARGDNGARYPWGDAEPTCDHAVSLRCDGEILPVGTRPAGISPYGALDMAGNAWEWVSDFYAHDFYAESPSTNPTGPTDGYLRAIRGATAWNDDVPLRASDRAAAAASANSALASFRCVGAP